MFQYFKQYKQWCILPLYNKGGNSVTYNTKTKSFYITNQNITDKNSNSSTK